MPWGGNLHINIAGKRCKTMTLGCSLRFALPSGGIPIPTHPNEVGILNGAGGHRFGYGGFGFCNLSLILTLYSLFKEQTPRFAIFHFRDFGEVFEKVF